MCGCFCWPFRRPSLILSHRRQQQFASEALDVGILRFHHRQCVSRSNVQLLSPRSTTTARPVPAFQSQSLCPSPTSQATRIPRDFLRFMFFCAAFTPRAPHRQRLKTGHRAAERLGSAAKLVIRLGENGQECAHCILCIISILENDSPATFIVNPSDGVSPVVIECVYRLLRPSRPSRLSCFLLTLDLTARL